MLKHAELVHFRTPTLAPGRFDFSGHWVNELNSYMDLQINGNVVTGTYVSAVTETGPGPTPPFPIYGSVSGDLINFNVNWGAEITAWIGHGVILASGAVRILTLWHIVHTVANEVVEAEHHAVYAPPGGRTWIDITPDQSPPATHRLFLPDDTAIYDFDKRGRGLSNVRKVYVDDPLLREHFRLKDERTAIEDSVEAEIGEIVELTGATREAYLRNEYQASLVQDQLMMKYTPQGAPCPCGSGRKFKRCHGKARTSSG